jgi:hypothetical protein
LNLHSLLQRGPIKELTLPVEEKLAIFKKVVLCRVNLFLFFLEDFHGGSPGKWIS